MKVLKFSIGFGPRVVGFTRGETEYRLSILPLGGYVKMAGEMPGEDINPAEAKRGFLAQPPWKRGLIVGAGPFFNLVFPILVYFFVFVGSHRVLAPVVGSVDAGTPAASVLEPGDHILAVDNEPVKTFEEMQAKVQPRFDHPLSLTLDRLGKPMTVHVTPMRSMMTNPLESVQRGFLGISSVGRPAIVGVRPGSPAEAAGFATFDRVTSINGLAIKSEVDLEKVLAAASGTMQVQIERPVPQAEPKPAAKPDPKAEPPTVIKLLTVPRQPGSGYAAMGADSVEAYVHQVVAGSPAAQAGIEPGDQLTSMDEKPLASFRMFAIALSNLGEKPFELGWRHGTGTRTGQLHQVKREVKDELGTVSEQLDVGLLPRLPRNNEVPESEYVSVYRGPVEALKDSLRIVPEVIGKTAMGIAFLFTGRLPFKSVGGPILLYQLASKTAEAGLESFLSLMALLSINLGLMNLLPIPALDGFQLLASIWEAVRRRPIPMRAREIANVVGLAMLVILMILVFKNDLTR